MNRISKRMRLPTYSILRWLRWCRFSPGTISCRASALASTAGLLGGGKTDRRLARILSITIAESGGECAESLLGPGDRQRRFESAANRGGRSAEVPDRYTKSDRAGRSCESGTLSGAIGSVHPPAGV